LFGDSMEEKVAAIGGGEEAKRKERVR